MLNASWETVVGLSVQLSARALLPDPSPLLEEERHASADALIANFSDPFPSQRSCTVAAFPSHNDPVDTLQIDRTQIFQQRLYRKESY